MGQTIAIIPAKGQSTRLPHKNIRQVFDHPLLAYSITGALRSQLFDRVIVSTDHPLTGAIAEWYGAEYLPRPAELATETASLVDVTLHALDYLEADGVKPELVCQLMPNCPLRSHQDIIEHHRLFVNNQRQFQISVVPYRGTYPQWALAADDQFAGSWYFDKKYLVNSQNLDTTYCPTGAIWWVQADAFREQKAYYGNPFHLAPMDGNRGMDIDRYDELELVEIIALGLWSRDGEPPFEMPTIPPFDATKQDIGNAVYHPSQSGQ